MEHQNAKAEQEAMTWAYVPCQMAEEDPNCYPADSFDHAYDDHAEVHVEEEACVHVEEHVIESEAPADMPVEEHVEEHVEPAPVEEHMEPAPVMEEAPVEEHVEPAPAAAMFIMPLVILSRDSDLLFQLPPINLLKASRKGSNEIASSCISKSISLISIWISCA